MYRTSGSNNNNGYSSGPSPPTRFPQPGPIEGPRRRPGLFPEPGPFPDFNNKGKMTTRRYSSTTKSQPKSRTPFPTLRKGIVPG